MLAGAANPQVLLIATGSEVGLALQAYERLAAERYPGARGEHAFLGIV